MKPDHKYKHVIKEYSWRASKYDTSHCRKFLNASQTIGVEVLNPRRGEKILDAGCGTGEILSAISKTIGKKGELVGIDLCEDMLDIAKKKLSNCSEAALIADNLENISYPDDYFNAVICVNVMHYFHDLSLVLKEFRRILKTEGRLILVGFCTDYFFFSLIERIWRIFIPSHIQAYRLKELSQEAKKSGFKIAASRRFKIGWFWRSMLLELKKE